MSRLASFLIFVATVLTGQVLNAQEQIYRHDGWSVTAIGPINCAVPPILNVRGSSSIFDHADELKTLTAGVAGALRAKCPDLREVVLIGGRTRRLVMLPAAPEPASASTPSSRPEPAPPRQSPAIAPSPQTAAPALETRAQPSTPERATPGRRSEPLATVREEPFALTGTWIGAYQIYPSYVQMTLRIASEPGTNGETSAEVRLEGLDGENSPHMGVSEAAIRYQPKTRVMEIRSGGSPGRNAGLYGLAFRAAYDADRKLFAGVRLNASSDASPYFVLARQGQEQTVFKHLRDMPNANARRNAQRIPIGPGGLPLGGSSPSEDSLRSWASQIYKEYPNVDPYRTEFGTYYSMARNLFRDEYFTSYFGKSYDQLGKSDMAKINRRLETMPPPRANFPEERGNSAAIPLGRGFWQSIGTYAAPDVMLSVLAMRSISAWMNQTLQRLPSIQASVGVFNALAELEAEEQGVLAMFWPSERQAFLKVVDSQRSRLADPVLEANVNQLLSMAQTFEDLPKLQAASATLSRGGSPSASRRPVSTNVTPNQRVRMPVPVRTPTATSREDIDSLTGMASEPLRKTLQGQIDQKITAIASSEASKDSAAIATLPAGLAGLESGSQWYEAMTRKYGNFRSFAPVSELFQRFVQARGVRFTQAMPELKSRIAAQSSVEQINAALAKYINPGLDRSIPAAAPVFAAAVERKAELERIAAEGARKAAEEAAKRAREAAAAAERAWRRPKPADTEIIRITAADMLPKPNSTPLQQAIESVVAILMPGGHGSAFLITKDGLAITNNHVVKDATAMKARFASGVEYAARVWRTDPSGDFALIQIACARDCYTSYLAAAPQPSPGTDIFVIGTPRDPQFSNSVTKGIVSGLRRRGSITDLQSDAAMNGGNSGGPMVEAESGRVVGVVTWKRTDADGIGFAGSIIDALRSLGVTLE